ncbi:hypothetical protein KEM48_002532 [Puccinia striiformis f. sp. tritici PST-130]|nr:hypothetical protein KEM48_002532 [Puccinia striiformis f. sp. tritici PST-130]
MVGTSSALADDFSQSTPADLTIVLQGADDPWGTPIWLRRAQTVADPQLKSTCSESLMAHVSGVSPSKNMSTSKIEPAGLGHSVTPE